MWALFVLLSCDIEYTIRGDDVPLGTTVPPREVLCGVASGADLVPSGLTKFSIYWAEYQYLGRQGAYIMTCPRPDIDHGLVVECTPTFTDELVVCVETEER